METMEPSASRQSLGLSVIIITKNEATRIADCLASVCFADEVIVLDGFSTDDTASVARALGAQVHQVADWPGFGPQKNRVLALATQPWVLSLDADERVTPELQAEIIQTLSDPTYDGYRLARLVGKLKACLLHFPFENLDALVVKINRYSGEAAKLMATQGKRVGVLGLIGHSVWTFIRIYLLKRGFLDGRHGFVLAVTAASGSFLRYSKLMFLNEAREQKKSK